MKRSALRVAVVALLAVAAIVAVAGTVDDVRPTGGSNPEEPDRRTQTETRTGTTQTQVTATTQQRALVDEGRDCVGTFQRPIVVLGILAVWGGIVASVYRRYGRLEAVSAFMLICVVVFLTYPFLALCERPKPDEPRNRSGGVLQEQNNSQEGGDGGDGTGTGEDGPVTPDLPIALAAVVAILAAAAIGGVLVTREDGDSDDPFESEADREDPEAAVDVDEFAAAAGRAADRIERTDDVDNEIYRAWVEMTEYLDVDHPETSTPGEFAAAAVEAGVDRDDVVELTNLFERVRYGSDPATTAREQRALEALRRIDAQYGGETS